MKEADALKHSSTVVNSLQKHETAQLWMALQNDKFDQFWLINRRLMEHLDGKPFKSIPFRLYPAKSRGDCFIQHNVKSCQLVTPPASEQEQQPDDQDSAPERRQSSSKQCTLSNLLETCRGPNDLTPACIILHGTQVPLETPLQWLSENMSYADNFLHLVLVE